MQRNIWPGLALAGGVLVAAIAALLLIGAGGVGPSGGPPPTATPPGVTRIFPGPGTGGTGTVPHRHKLRAAIVPLAVGTAPGGSAATTQYGADGNRGTVLGSP